MEHIVTSHAEISRLGRGIGPNARLAKFRYQVVWARTFLDELSITAAELFSDDTFVTLLRAESLLILPSSLSDRLRNSRRP